MNSKFTSAAALFLFPWLSALRAEDPQLSLQLDVSKMFVNETISVVLRNGGDQPLTVPLFDGRPQICFEVWSHSYGAKFRRKSELEMDAGGAFAPGRYDKLVLPPGGSREYNFKLAELSSGEEEKKLNKWLLEKAFIESMRAALSLSSAPHEENIWIFSKTEFFNGSNREAGQAKK
jgi:hypothetical protein